MRWRCLLSFFFFFYPWNLCELLYEVFSKLLFWGFCNSKGYQDVLLFLKEFSFTCINVFFFKFLNHTFVSLSKKYVSSFMLQIFLSATPTQAVCLLSLHFQVKQVWHLRPRCCREERAGKLCRLPPPHQQPNKSARSVCTSNISSRYFSIAFFDSRPANL